MENHSNFIGSDIILWGTNPNGSIPPIWVFLRGSEVKFARQLIDETVVEEAFRCTLSSRSAKPPEKICHQVIISNYSLLQWIKITQILHLTFNVLGLEYSTEVIISTWNRFISTVGKDPGRSHSRLQVQMLTLPMTLKRWAWHTNRVAPLTQFPLQFLAHLKRVPIRSV